MTEEEYSMWRDSPVTQALYRALDKKSQEAMERWLQASWESGKCDERLLADLKATSNICIDIINMTFEELEAALEG